MICQKSKIKCIECSYRELKTVTDETIKCHLTGESSKKKTQGHGKPFVMGLYPMLKDETCRFLAIDFDKNDWKKDVSSFLESCKDYDIPAYLERSRSGKGGHIWIFFSEPIKASKARKFGTFLITKTLDKRPEIGLDSFDRFFPNQDTLPKGGFGNLIALPLQKQARKMGNSCFINEDFEPYSDQWLFLSSIIKLDNHRLDQILLNECPETDLLYPNPEESALSPQIAIKDYPKVDLPHTLEVSITISSQIYIESRNIPPIIRNRILRLAAFSNPEFYKNQAMRLPTWNKPRILYCYQQYETVIAIPVGCLTGLNELFNHYDIKVIIKDDREPGNPIPFIFNGKLYRDQKRAALSLLKNDTGILSATTAFGKTIVALWVISQRQTNTLVLVHRKQLVEQWKERISQFLNIPPNEIGQIGGGKKKRFGKIDVAVIQSVNKRGKIEPWIKEYGQIIVDECHHISAYSFEQVIRQCPARYKLGLSATVIRKVSAK